MARAYQDNGDYKVLGKFRREGDRENAEQLLNKVSGPTWRMRQEQVKERTVSSGDSVPVGMGQRPKAVLNLLKSFDDLHEALDEVQALKSTELEPMNISINSIEDDYFIEYMDSIIKVSSDTRTTKESENETNTKSPVKLIEKQLRKRHPITYTEER